MLQQARTNDEGAAVGQPMRSLRLALLALLASACGAAAAAPPASTAAAPAAGPRLACTDSICRLKRPADAPKAPPARLQ